MPSQQAGSGDDDFFTLGPVQETAAESKPWGRLVVIVPLSIALGLGAVHGQRFLQGRGVIADL